MKNQQLLVGRYRITKEIGKGGFSKVYAGEDIHNKNNVAIKQYKTSDVYNHSQQMEDVEREIDALKYVSHPNLPKVHNIIFHENSFYLVMEYVEGECLADIIRTGRLKKQQVANIGEQILSAMYYLHSLEPAIVYRDLKPSNVIVQKNGNIKIIDFGNSKRYNRDVSAGVKAYGTPNFAAPEQYGDERGMEIYNTDIRTDIYSLGALLHYLATGKKINERLNLVEKIIYRIRFGTGFRRMINRATRHLPGERYQNDVAMLVDLYRACRIKI